MVEGYIFYEALGLYTKCMQNFGATNKRIWDANEKKGVAREALKG
jgi:hypothetical protein